MARASFRVSAPGSLMLLGEHAVLHGRRSLCGAVDKRMEVKLTPQKSGILHIISALGSYESPVRELAPSSRFSFIIHAVGKQRDRLPGGLRLDVKSGFSSTVGLGSSAAVTVATTAALMEWAGQSYSREDIFREARGTIRAVQGLGSGADAAASVFGGVLVYRMDPLEIRRLTCCPPLTLVYSGYKEPTVKVVQLLEQRRNNDPEYFERLFDAIDQSVPQAAGAVEAQDWPALGKILNGNQEFMSQMELSTPDLDRIIEILRSRPNIFGAKISGSGLGDCAVGIGDIQLRGIEYEQIDVKLSPRGVEID